MRANGVKPANIRRAASIAMGCFFAVGCITGAPEGEVSGDELSDTTMNANGFSAMAETGHSATITTLAGLLPADTRGIFAINLEALMSGGSSEQITSLLNGEGADPALNELFSTVGTLAETVDVPRVLTSALLVQTTDAADGVFLLASLRGETLDEVWAGPMPAEDGTHGPSSDVLYLDENGNQLAVLADGVLVVGRTAAVESVLDAAEGAALDSAGAIRPFLEVLDGESHFSFVYGLPALFDDDVARDQTLTGAVLMSGALDVVDGEFRGAMAFHTSNAAEFVEAYNNLNRHALQAEDPLEQPLTVGEPVVDDLGQVVVVIPTSPIDASPDQVVASRNVFKKLFVGMQGYDYAKGVAKSDNAAWLDFVVKSDQDDDAPPPAASVYIRWEFQDQAAIEAFEANELPAGFKLAPTRFFESDDPDGEYFLTLNLYNAGGGSIVSGARAEWDVFVHPPAGADPNAGERPRFMVVDVASEDVSADSANLLTPAQPLSHEIVDDLVVSTVRRFDGDREIPVFESAFPRPDPEQAPVARFTREMAIGNDYIYWDHGVSDRVLYNATTFNHDAYFVDTTQMTFTDDSKWAQYLKPSVKDAVYYANTLEYVASPMANLQSDYLDITPEWLSELVGFTTNGHQEGLMRKAVEQLFRGEADVLVGFRVNNETPSTYFNFEITDPDALSAAIDLPPGYSLTPTALFEGAPEAHYLTLSIYEIENSVEGTRAEWSVYTDDGSGRPNMVVLDLITAEVGIDPVSIFNLPSLVRHELVDGVVSARLSSDAIEFEASFETAGATEEAVSLDWIEAGDNVCSANGICDKFYYDAETLDVPVHRPTEIAMSAFASPWSEFVSATPSIVFYRDNAQEYVVKRWHNLEVSVEELPFSGLDGRTHIISGSGTLVGRDSEVADSDYIYTGDAVLEGDQLTFSIDQQVDNALGVAHIFTTGVFSLTSGTGTQTVVDCQGPALLCSDIAGGSTAFYTAQDLEASNPDDISWQVNVAVSLGGFGTADSVSAFTATLVD